MRVQKPQISVIVPAYNEEKYIGKCLDSLTNQDLDKNLYEILVIDNNSTDKTGTVALAYPVKMFLEKRKGVAYTRSLGVEKSQGQIIAFTDSDCIVPKNWISNFLAKFAKDPKLDAAGGVFAFYDGNKFLKTLALKTQKFTWHLSGGNMAIRRKSLSQIGGFEPLVHAGEDVLLTLKLQKQGTFLIDQNNVVQTSSRRFSDNFLKTILMYFPNDFSLKYFHRPFFSHFPDVR